MPFNIFLLSLLINSLTDFLPPFFILVVTRQANLSARVSVIEGQLLEMSQAALVLLATYAANAATTQGAQAPSKRRVAATQPLKSVAQLTTSVGIKASSTASPKPQRQAKQKQMSPTITVAETAALSAVTSAEAVVAGTASIT